jgi:hypothetical protein
MPVYPERPFPERRLNAGKGHGEGRWGLSSTSRGSPGPRRETNEAAVDAVTGALASPRGPLLGRYDSHERIQYTGRATTFAQATSSTLAGLLAPARPGHPWAG